MDAKPIHVGVLVAHAPAADVAMLEAFTRRLQADLVPFMEDATGVEWRFHTEDGTRIASDEGRRAADFLGVASLRMVEGPYDAMVVVTDVPLVSRAEHVVPGLVSPAARVAVVSTRQLRLSPRGDPLRPMDSASVRWNGAALLAHLIGHTLGLGHDSPGAGSVMAPFDMVEERRSIPPFVEEARSRVRQAAANYADREARDVGTSSEIAFHVRSGLRHAGVVLATLWRSRAPLLPLRLPRLTTAAVAPAFILVFTAEIWDAGFHMTAGEVWLFAILSVLGSTAYLAVAQELFLPRKEKRLHTEHLAVVNVAILLIILALMAGLFLLLAGLMLIVQIFIFPPDLVREWPSLELGSATIGLTDQLRIAALISTIGVLTGALAGGLESRSLLRHLALFEREP